MQVLDQVAHYHGRLSDSRVVWWPFLFLKPHSSREQITLGKTLLMTPCFAAWFLMAWLLRDWLVGDRRFPSAGQLARTYFHFVIGFFVWFNAVTAPLWNWRAKGEHDRKTEQRSDPFSRP